MEAAPGPPGATRGATATAHASATLVTFAVLLGACAPGDRCSARACPPDEVCSCETPQGLVFDDSSLYGYDLDPLLDDSPHATAVGGRQTLLVRRNEPGDPPVFGQPFRVEAAPGIFEATAVDPPYITLRAHAPGESTLRVLDPDTGALYDRVTLRAYAVEHVQIVPAEFLFEPDAAWAIHDDPGSWLAVRLSGSGHVLVDEDLVIEARDASDTVIGEPRSWDQLSLAHSTIEGPALGITLAAPSVGTTTISIPVEDHADEIRLLFEEATPLRIDGPARVCFEAIAHPDTPDERRVCLMRWRYSVTGPAALDVLTGLAGTNCAEFWPNGYGAITITAEVDGATYDHTVTVHPADG